MCAPSEENKSGEYVAFVLSISITIIQTVIDLTIYNNIMLFTIY